MLLKQKRISQSPYENMSVEDLEYVLTLRGRSNASVGDTDRQLNRQWNQALASRRCQVCNYEKHVELAHLKGIALFDKQTLLKEINHQDNILVLCRNCHWEFDNDLLELADIPVR